jgi:hypothetical protein
VTQHIVVIGPNEVACQGYCCHMITTCDLCGPLPRHNAVEIRNERGPLGHTTTVQGLSGDQVGPRRGLHARTTTHKSKLCLMFKEAKAAGKRAFWPIVELSVDDIQICPPSSI